MFLLSWNFNIWKWRVIKSLAMIVWKLFPVGPIVFWKKAPSLRQLSWVETNEFSHSLEISTPGSIFLCVQAAIFFSKTPIFFSLSLNSSSEIFLQSGPCIVKCFVCDKKFRSWHQKIVFGLHYLYLFKKLQKMLLI